VSIREDEALCSRFRAEVDAMDARYRAELDALDARAARAELDAGDARFRAALDALGAGDARFRAELDAMDARYRAALGAGDARDARYRAELDELCARFRAELDAMGARFRAELDAMVELAMLVPGQQGRSASRLTDGENLRLHVDRIAQVWSCFGFVLPAHSREKFLGSDLLEHTADLFAALAAAESPCKQNLLIVSHTIIAIAKVINCVRVTAQRRLRDEFDWVAGRLTQK
jgi:hypothetical protein